VDFRVVVLADNNKGSGDVRLVDLLNHHQFILIPEASDLGFVRRMSHSPKLNVSRPQYESRSL